MEQLYLPSEPPNGSCRYYSSICDKWTYCPAECLRYKALEEFNKDMDE